MKLVIIESPFAGDVKTNIKYARKCICDCLKRNESPIASHLLFTQKGILNDLIPEERTLGVKAGLSWYKVADLSAVYTDMGISKGMKEGIIKAKQFKVNIEYRTLKGE